MVFWKIFDPRNMAASWGGRLWPESFVCWRQSARMWDKLRLAAGRSKPTQVISMAILRKPRSSRKLDGAGKEPLFWETSVWGEHKGIECTRAHVCGHRDAYGMAAVSGNGFPPLTSLFLCEIYDKLFSWELGGRGDGDWRSEEKGPNRHPGRRLMNLQVELICQTVLSAHWRVLTINLEWILTGWLYGFYLAPLNCFSKGIQYAARWARVWSQQRVRVERSQELFSYGRWLNSRGSTGQQCL